MPRGAAVVVQPILRQDVQDVQGSGGCDEISLSWKERSRENDDVRKKENGGVGGGTKEVVSERVSGVAPPRRRIPPWAVCTVQEKGTFESSSQKK